MLVVDKEADVCEFLERFFSERDFWVITMRDQKEALDVFKKDSFDVVVFDVDTGILEVFDTIEQMCQFREKVNLIVISEHNDQEKIDKAYSLGASRYISKPLVLEELESAVMR